KIVARNGNASGVGNYESGWKDDVYLPKGESVSFVAKFDDYADAVHPFMYHCHFANHEDGGMMGQFVVTDQVGIKETSLLSDFTIFPNPTKEKIFVQLGEVPSEIYYATITNSAGKIVMMLPKPELSGGIDVSHLKKGTYFLELIEQKSKAKTTKKFIID
ncbi:MAG: T9SS C-terminal target domain-containing protein, partial [Flavobacteriales bacterium]|nr:T9SS C-terminal target domain-containing protein [Flavobacteriales bacterium]